MVAGRVMDTGSRLLGVLESGNGDQAAIQACLAVVAFFRLVADLEAAYLALSVSPSRFAGWVGLFFSYPCFVRTDSLVSR